jgi:hypothetical protein
LRGGRGGKAPGARQAPRQARTPVSRCATPTRASGPASQEPRASAAQATVRRASVQATRRPGNGDSAPVRIEGGRMLPRRPTCDCGDSAAPSPSSPVAASLGPKDTVLFSFAGLFGPGPGDSASASASPVTSLVARLRMAARGRGRAYGGKWHGKGVCRCSLPLYHVCDSAAHPFDFSMRRYMCWR